MRDEKKPHKTDTITVSHDPVTSELPKLKPGDRIVACGLFSIDPRLSDRAIIDNTAQSYDGYHTDGFLMVNGTIFD